MICKVYSVQVVFVKYKVYIVQILCFQSTNGEDSFVIHLFISV